MQTPFLEMISQGFKDLRAKNPRLANMLFALLAYFIYKFLRGLFKAKLAIKGKVVLVTGGASGIGKLTAERFAALGAKVVVWDINEAAMKKMPAMIPTFKCNVSNRAEVMAVAAETKRKVGDVDVLINNAGIVSGTYILKTSESAIRRTFDVNTISHFWTVQAFMPPMLKKNSGHIVTIASAAGQAGCSQMVDYCASKYAALGFDESLRRELQHLGKDGVRTTVICPYLIDTGMFDGAEPASGIWKIFANLLPPAYVADSIVNAILDGEQMVILPRRLGSISALKGVMPLWLQDFLITKYMDMTAFTGH